MEILYHISLKYATYNLSCEGFGLLSGRPFLWVEGRHGEIIPGGKTPPLQDIMKINACKN
ncbi:MAG: hypothetical protein UW80_C0033G0005 [Microgenomates group bacterium GW2011_GWC1_44_9]|nr:MAG: hypothetical protein UW80_C0033G0005 [Microgenomates group bacterium GW2011_GWC1_44_9]